MTAFLELEAAISRDVRRTIPRALGDSPGPLPTCDGVLFGMCLIALALCRRWERKHVSRFRANGHERDALRLRYAVLAPQMPVGFHGSGAAVFMCKPAGNGRNVHARFKTACYEQMPQIMMSDALGADLFTYTIKGLLTFADAE